MRYTHLRPPIPSFIGKGLFGYTFGPLQQKDLEIYYIEVEKGHDTFMVSKRITRVYYVLSGSGFFTIGDLRYDVRSGMLVEVPPKVEYSYSGKMKLIGISKPRWFSSNDKHTKWNYDVGHGEVPIIANADSWKSLARRIINVYLTSLGRTSGPALGAEKLAAKAGTHMMKSEQVVTDTWPTRTDPYRSV